MHLLFSYIQILIYQIAHSFSQFIPTFIIYFNVKEIDSGALIAIPAISVALLLPIILLIADKEQVYAFDKNIVFERILNYKIFITFILIISWLLCFQSNPIIKILVVCLEFYLIVLDVHIAYYAYKWFCSYGKIQGKITDQQAMRLKYLGDLDSPEVIYETWQDVFSGNIKDKNQVGIVDAYIAAYEKLNDREYEDDDYSRNTGFSNLLINNLRDIRFDNYAQYRRLVDFSLNYVDVLAKQKERKDQDYFIASDQERLFFELCKLSLEDPDSYRKFAFFTEVYKYSKRMDNETIYYFTYKFIPDFLQIIEKGKYGSIDLKTIYPVSKRQIRSSDFISNEGISRKRGIVDGYMIYMREKIISPKIDHKTNKIIDELTQILFPDVDLVLWIDMISFVCFGELHLLQCDAELNSVIMKWCKHKKERRYGLFSRNCVVSISYRQDLTEEENAEYINDIYQQSRDRMTEETIRLLRYIFPEYLNKHIISQVKKAAKEIIHSSDYKVYHNILDILTEDMEIVLTFINSEEKLI